MRFNNNCVADSLLTTIFQFTDGNDSLSKRVLTNLQFLFPIETLSTIVFPVIPDPWKTSTGSSFNANGSSEQSFAGKYTVH